MPDLFPTTDEADKDQNIAEAAAGGQGIVNHLGRTVSRPMGSGPSSSIGRSASTN